MTWTMMAIRELADGGDAVLYPKPTSERNGIVFDEWDGQCAHPITATQVRLQQSDARSGDLETILKAESVKLSLYITESRIAVACTKYDKGGGWFGGVGALALNAVSKARAAIRSQGKSLVGHVRYPWLRAVAFSPKTGWLSDEMLRLLTVDRTGGVDTKYLLDLTLPKSVSSEKVAREIVQRAARFRLARTSFESAEERSGVEAMLDPPPRHADKKSMSVWTFKSSYSVRESTAFGDLPSPSAVAVAAAPINGRPSQGAPWWN